jgi:undecaprenyl diphosphate synthase
MSDSTTKVPEHIGFILDGNRRWARARSLPTLEGHRRGYNKLKKIADAAFEKGVKFVSVFIFSTENWNRSKNEVSFLMDLALKMATRDLKEIHAKNIKIIWLGSEEHLSKKLIKALKNAVKTTKNNNKGTLALCFNYGGKAEIVQAVRKIIKAGYEPEDVTEESIANNLYVPTLPPIDIVVRTSGELRLSNFMLWRVAYSELMFINKYWPDFDTDDLNNVIAEYSKRQPRLGG